VSSTERIVPYQPANLSEPADLVAAIRQRRGGHFLNLDRMLLHSPALASGWNVYLGQIRQHLSLDGRLREMAMCGVAVLNGAEYEFIQHAPVYLKEGGTEAELAVLRQLGSPAYDASRWSQPLDRAVCELIVQMTRNIRVDDAVMRALQGQLGNQALVELVAVIGAYNMVSRFLVALDVHPEADTP
jgi:alkylhydroperoxidase family enzyme